MGALTGCFDAFSSTLPFAMLVAARLGPMVVVTPFFSVRGAPASFRLALVLALTLAFLPMAERAPLPEGGFALALLALRELAIGTAWAVAIGVPFHAADVAGRLVDLGRGASLAEVIAPSTGDRTSPLGELTSLATVALFFSLGGHRLALAGFAHALAALPIGVVGEGRFGMEAVRVVASGLSLGVVFAAPVLVALLVVEVGLGLVARASPKVQVFFVGMPLRAGLGVAALALVFTRIVAALPAVIREALSHAGRILGG